MARGVQGWGLLGSEEKEKKSMESRDRSTDRMCLA